MCVRGSEFFNRPSNSNYDSFNGRLDILKYLVDESRSNYAFEALLRQNRQHGYASIEQVYVVGSMQTYIGASEASVIVLCMLVILLVEFGYLPSEVATSDKQRQACEGSST